MRQFEHCVTTVDLNLKALQLVVKGRSAEKEVAEKAITLGRSLTTAMALTMVVLLIASSESTTRPCSAVSHMLTNLVCLPCQTVRFFF